MSTNLIFYIQKILLFTFYFTFYCTLELDFNLIVDLYYLSLNLLVLKLLYAYVCF